MGYRMFFSIEMGILVSTIYALFVSWHMQRRYHQPNLLRRIWAWHGCEVTFFLVFLQTLGILAGGYLGAFLSSLTGIGNAKFLLVVVGAAIGMKAMQLLIVKELNTQFMQAMRDLETASPPQPPEES